MKKISLLLADVDGTLVTKDKVLTDRAVKAVHGLRDKGIKFAITSGRPPQGMKMLLGKLQLETPIAGFNGGMFVNPDLSPIEEKRLPKEVAKQTVDMLLENQLDCWVYYGADWYLRDPKAPHAEREQRTVQFSPKITDDLYSLLDNAVKIVGVSDDLDLVAATEKKLQEAVHGQATAARSQPYYLDVTHSQANKGEVVDFLAKRYGIAPDEIATIGDQPNDLMMFKPSGFSIAMGNAPQEVKDQASATTDSCEEEGFAKAVEKYLLNEEQA